MTITRFINAIKRICHFPRRRKAQEDPIELQVAEPEPEPPEEHFFDLGDLAVMELSDQWNDHPPIFHDARGNVQVYMEIVVNL